MTITKRQVHSYYAFRNSDNIPCFSNRHNFFKNLYNILQILPMFFHCQNLAGIEYIAKIRHDLSELGEHKIKHSFKEQ